MVDIMLPVGGTGGVRAATTATVKTVTTESGPQQIIVIPQSLFQANTIGTTTTTAAANLASKKQAIRISPATSPQQRTTLKRPLPKEEIKSEIMTDVTESKPPRKRANLDHLTPEEKMMRRKLKNRVAAQNARDKKRVKMDTMEGRLESIEREMAALREENKRLMEVNARLFSENQALKGASATTTTLNSLIKEEMPPSPDSLPPPHSPSPSSCGGDSVDLHDQGIVVGRPNATAARPRSANGSGPERAQHDGSLVGRRGVLSLLDVSRGASVVVSGSEAAAAGKVPLLQIPAIPQLPNKPVVTAQEAILQPGMVGAVAPEFVDTCQDLEQILEPQPTSELKMNFVTNNNNNNSAEEDNADSLLDKLLVSAGVINAETDSGSSSCDGSSADLGEAQAWEESFNELFPDLI